MKTKQVFAVMITSLFLLYGCSNNEDSIEVLEVASKKFESNGSSEIHREYPKEQAEVLATFGAIGATITEGAGSGYGSDYMNQLISFHAYDENFVEFNGGISYDSAGNEVNERTLFGTVVDLGGVKKFAAVPGTLKVAVYYGNVANLTFISDFELLIGGELLTVNNLITLLFIKTDGEWKMNHEHHSPVNLDDLQESSTGSNPSTPNLDSDAQKEVLATFGAIGESISLGAGKGYNGEYMDQLISFHAYGQKFTEFNNGLAFDSKGNEHNERQLFGEDLEEDGVKNFGYAPGTLKVAVYNGNVANVTFLSDFILDFKGGNAGVRVNNLITLLFVKTKGNWKLVHEHHSNYMGQIDWVHPLP